FLGWGAPGVLAAGAGVGDRLPGRVDDGDGPAGSGVAGRGGDEGLGFVGVEEAEAVGLGGGAGPAEEGADGDDEVEVGWRRRCLSGAQRPAPWGEVGGFVGVAPSGVLGFVGGPGGGAVGSGVAGDRS